MLLSYVKRSSACRIGRFAFAKLVDFTEDSSSCCSRSTACWSREPEQTPGWPGGHSPMNRKSSFCRRSTLAHFIWCCAIDEYHNGLLFRTVAAYARILSQTREANPPRKSGEIARPFVRKDERSRCVNDYFLRCADLSSRPIQTHSQHPAPKQDWNNMSTSPPPSPVALAIGARTGIFGMCAGDQHRPSSGGRHRAEVHVRPPRRAHGLRPYGSRLVLQGTAACTNSFVYLCDFAVILR